MKTQEKSPTLAGTRGRAQNKNITQMKGNSLTEQCQRLLGYLRFHGSITTIVARRDLDIIHPAGRICELRKAGYGIDTVWTTDINENGKEHRVANYILKVKEQKQ
ncbi:helix-turn-helix domain-containing protein [Thermodesulfobacteriota bacterium]